MNDELGTSDDISQLWGDDDGGAWEAAPARRPAPPAAPPTADSGNGQADRLDALERDVQALMQVVERVEALVNERLIRLEQQVVELAARDQPTTHKGIGRFTDVLRPTRNR